MIVGKISALFSCSVKQKYYLLYQRLLSNVGQCFLIQTNEFRINHQSAGGERSSDWNI